jgi:hypothetical protein
MLLDTEKREQSQPHAAMYLMSSIYRASLVHKELVSRERQETKPVFLGLSDPALTSAPSEKSRSGISWMEWNCPPGVSLLGQ